MSDELWYVVLMYFVGVAAGTHFGISLERDAQTKASARSETGQASEHSK